MISYNEHTLAQYLEKLSCREPVPGGGSAGAVAGALGAALLGMSARYALGKGKPPEVERKISDIVTRVDTARLKLLGLAGEDAQAYLDVVSTRKSGDKPLQEKAKVAAALVPREIMDLCQQCLGDVPYLHQQGNPHLVSDVKAAEALLKAGIQACGYMQEANA